MIKIGVSSDPKSRLAALQTASPDPLSIVATLRGPDADEALIHARFAHCRQLGEWFRPSPDLLDWIEEVKNG